MHQSALHFGKAFFDNYFTKSDTKDLVIVDIGSRDINGSLRQFSPLHAQYIGVDFDEGNGVDIIITDPYSLPFENESVDAIVCSSVFEHSEFFWILFTECLRIVKPNGLIYINAPSNGMVHRYPIDGWRFYPDAGHSLVNWAKRQGQNVVLMESFIGPKMGAIEGEGMWNDFVAVFLKDESYTNQYLNRIANFENDIEYAYTLGFPSTWVPGGSNPDHRYIVNHSKLISELKIDSDEKSSFITALKDKNNNLAAENRKFYNELNSANAEISALKSSTSWKITSPLRRVSTLIKGRKSTLNIISQHKGKSIDFDHVTPNTSENSPSFEILSGKYVQQSGKELDKDKSKLIAFYLPQYHRVTENSEWWGPGFTEWTNVVKGKPNFEDHYQPHLPRELGFYDLSNIEVMREQTELAKLYGVGAFCFYYYWFSGRRILEKPIDNFFKSDIDMSYCLCWANENWTRTWDGDTRSVLLEQKYLEEDPQLFIESVLPHFHDSRYIKVDGKPMLVVYRAKNIPDVGKVFGIWRDFVKASGFPDLHIAVVDFYDISRPEEVGADALVEFPPHKFNGGDSVPNKTPTFSNENFRGGIVDYAKVLIQSAKRPVPDFTLYRAAMPSWDNTARRQDTPTIIYGSSPELFKEWLSYLRAYSRENFNNREDQFIFINAWNEWGEGCHLEPDQKYGLQFLESVRKSSWFSTNLSDSDHARKSLLDASAKSIVDREINSLNQHRYIKSESASNISAYGSAKRISDSLRNYPVLHRIGKFIYKQIKFIRK